MVFAPRRTRLSGAESILAWTPPQAVGSEALSHSRWRRDQARPANRRGRRSVARPPPPSDVLRMVRAVTILSRRGGRFHADVAGVLKQWRDGEREGEFSRGHMFSRETGAKLDDGGPCGVPWDQQGGEVQLGRAPAGSRATTRTEGQFGSDTIPLPAPALATRSASRLHYHIQSDQFMHLCRTLTMNHLTSNTGAGTASIVTFTQAGKPDRIPRSSAAAMSSGRSTSSP